MDTLLDNGLVWWITVIDIPAMSALFWMIIRNRKEQDRAIHELLALLELRCTQLTDGLSCFKLEVAKSYASIVEMKDVESRIISHLLRIEKKLDLTALKAEALGAKSEENKHD